MAKKKKRKYHRRKSLIKFKFKKQTANTVGAIWMWIFAIIIIISFIGEGVILNRIKEELTYFIGWIYYLMPPFLVSLSFLFFQVKSPLSKPNVPGGLAIILFSLTGLTQAGVIGGAVWLNTVNALAPEGAALIFLAGIIIGLIVLFNTSLDRFINFIFLGFNQVGHILGNFISSLNSKKSPDFLSRNKSDLKISGSTDDKGTGKIQPSSRTEAIPRKPAVSAAQNPSGNLKLPLTTPTQAAETQIWEYPPISLLAEGPGRKADRGDVRKNASIIEGTLDSFGIKADVAEVNRGPAVTQYALKLSLGTKVSKITSLSSDLALALAAPTGQVRIEAPIPGRDLVGIEIPNRGLEFVTLKRMLESDSMKKSKSKLAVALGLDVSGNPIIADIGKMPHVLVAGTTGSGKSVLVNAWICSVLFRTTPQEVRLILVDPKRVELIGYNGVPHLLTPVIVEPDKILSALRWAMGEMDERYKRFAKIGVRNIDGFNQMSGFQAMPYIMIFIDELADLMVYAPVEVEDTICRIAQMARATGIHLILATQRPSVDVITGLIKANIPSRVAFNVSSMVDSRVIIDTPGAEKLLGRGDMLYVPPDQAKPSRIQGTFVSEHEVNNVVEHLKTKNIPVNYTEEVLTQPVNVGKRGSLVKGGFSETGVDSLFEDAIRLICQHDKASASLLQRRLSVGYARAARILDQLESEGIIGPAEGSKPRDVLIKDPNIYFEQKAQNQDSDQTPDTRI